MGELASEFPDVAFIPVESLADKDTVIVQNGNEREVPTNYTVDHLADPDLPLAIFYTSGTTGAAKGVLLSHGNMLVQAQAKCNHIGYGPGTRYLHAAPLYHVGGFNSSIAITIAGGLQIFCGAFSPSRFLSAIPYHAINTLVMVPTALQLLLDETQRHQLPPLPLIHTILYGGNPMNPSLLIQLRSHFPHAQIIQAYGMTETTSSITFLRHTHSGNTSLDLTVGHAPDHVDIKIDPIGSALGLGEILTRGPHVMLEYWGRPQETQEAFRPGGWFRTGDLGRFEESRGVLTIEGRMKDMVKTGGENVLCAEVERVLMEYPGVSLAVVFGVPDPIYVEVVVAAVVIRPGGTVSRQGLSNKLILHCRTSLARFKVPRHVWIVDAHEVPVNASGKVLKHVLRLRLQGRHRSRM
uniref:AMP-dependent synthetase/ligase domain-containing protein n=1 Tax=Compsopogon caeruleus TaxID=31354 RepID=A0A7S1TE43_9RHOD